MTFFLAASPSEGQALPTGWAATSIGGAAGAGSFNNGTFTVSSNGWDIYGTSDQFTFIQRSITGDATITARVSSFNYTDSASKVGLMFRDSLAANSRNVFALVSGASGLALQNRSTTGGSTAMGSLATGRAPLWLRLERRGSQFIASRSSDGSSWQTLGSVSVSLNATVYVGLALASHRSGVTASAGLTSVTYTGSSPSPSEPSTSEPPPSGGGIDGALPSGWTSQDVGSPAVSGVAAYSGGVYLVDGAGADISGTNDQFRYAYRPMTGDVDIITRVASLQNVHEWSKAGPMIRQSLAGNASYGMALVSPLNGVAFQQRNAAGASSTSTSGGGGQAPVWLKLEKRGSLVTGFRSADGVNWSVIGSQAITLGSTFYVGLAVTSHNATVRARGTFDGVITRVASTGNQAPSVSLTAPASGATFTAPASIAFAATAGDTDGSIARVDFYAGATLVGSDTSSPYSYTWSNVPAGSYSLTAVARDNAGATTTSAARSVQVNTGGNQAPSVSLTAPANGAYFVAPASIAFAATASDTDGSIARVDFYAGATLVGSDTTSPYAYTWNNVPAGSYALTAVARDNGGATTVSGTRDVQVGATALLTTAVFAASADHVDLVQYYVFHVFPAGADPATANPVASQNLGKPSPVGGQITADVRNTIAGLPAGNYIATVTAVGASGGARSAPSAAFAR